MRRNRRRHITDLFYNTGDLNERTVDESFTFSREFTNTINQEMLEEERIMRKHEQEQQQQQGQVYPSCDLRDRPPIK